MKKTHATLDLGGGIKLAKGTIFEVVIRAANLGNANLERPAQWDGLRYHNLRQQAASDERTRRGYEWGAATIDDMSFGYGSHQCPGKSAGCNMLKILLLKIILRYELKPEAGITQRYEDVSVGQYVSFIQPL